MSDGLAMATFEAGEVRRATRALLTLDENGTRDFTTDVGSNTRGTRAPSQSLASCAKPPGGKLPSHTARVALGMTLECLSTKS